MQASSLVSPTNPATNNPILPTNSSSPDSLTHRVDLESTAVNTDPDPSLDADNADTTGSHSPSLLGRQAVSLQQRQGPQSTRLHSPANSGLSPPKLDRRLRDIVNDQDLVVASSLLKSGSESRLHSAEGGRESAAEVGVSISAHADRPEWLVTREGEFLPTNTTGTAIADDYPREIPAIRISSSTTTISPPSTQTAEESANSSAASVDSVPSFPHSLPARPLPRARFSIPGETVGSRGSIGGAYAPITNPFGTSQAVSTNSAAPPFFKLMFQFPNTAYPLFHHAPQWPPGSQETFTFKGATSWPTITDAEKGQASVATEMRFGALHASLHPNIFSPTRPSFPVPFPSRYASPLQPSVTNASPLASSNASPFLTPGSALYGLPPFYSAPDAVLQNVASPYQIGWSTQQQWRQQMDRQILLQRQQEQLQQLDREQQQEQHQQQGHQPLSSRQVQQQFPDFGILNLNQSEPQAQEIAAAAAAAAFPCPAASHQTAPAAPSAPAAEKE